MKSIRFAVTLAGMCLLAGTASAQTRYASRGYYDEGPVQEVGFHHGYNAIEAGGCCGGPVHRGCGPCCRPCVLPCVLRAIGRAVDCLLPCGRCCHGGGCGLGCCRVGCGSGGYVHARPPLYGGHHGGGCASCGGGGDDHHYSAPFAPAMKADPFQDDMPEAMPTPAPARANPARSSGSSRVVRPARTASMDRPQYEDELPVKRIAAGKSKQIIGTGVAKVVHEEAVTVNKPVTSLKKLPRDDAPSPPSLLIDDEDEQRIGMPRNPLRR